jgi:hypothetical protein
VGATFDVSLGDLDALLGDINPNRFVFWRNTGTPSGSDLKLAVSDPIWLASPSTGASYVISVTNQGPALAQLTQLTLGPLDRLSFVDTIQWTAPTPVSCWFAYPVGGCDIGHLANGEEIVLEVEITYRDLFPSNTTGAREANIPLKVSSRESDPDPANNSAILEAILYNCNVFTNWDCVATEIWCSLISESAIARQALSIKQAVQSLPPFHLPDLYKVRDLIMAGTPIGQHYIDLYYTHDAEIMGLLLGSSALRDQAVDTLTAWQSNLAALVDGEGESVIITAEQVQMVDDFLTALSAVASPHLSQVIAEEWIKLPLPDEFVGMSMKEARELVIGYSVNLPLIIR